MYNQSQNEKFKLPLCAAIATFSALFFVTTPFPLQPFTLRFTSAFINKWIDRSRKDEGKLDLVPGGL